MQFDDHLDDGIVLFEVSGKIMGGDVATMFRGRLREYLNLNKVNFVIDMSRVEWINSVGLGMLTASLASVRNAGGRFVLADISRVENILTITRLVTVFEHYDSRHEALTAVRRPAER